MVVIAELTAPHGRRDELAALAHSFAADCLAHEPGCRQFQVVELETSPDRLLFFEVYDDTAAFEAHRGSGHLSRFKEAFKDLVVAEQPLRLGLLRGNPPHST